MQGRRFQGHYLEWSSLGTRERLRFCKLGEFVWEFEICRARTVRSRDADVRKNATALRCVCVCVCVCGVEGTRGEKRCFLLVWCRDNIIKSVLQEALLRTLNSLNKIATWSRKLRSGAGRWKEVGMTTMSDVWGEPIQYVQWQRRKKQQNELR